MVNPFDSKEFKDFIFDHSLIFEDRSDIAMQRHRERPYTGQPQTLFGKRGKAKVEGLTMRDIADCIARGLAQTLRKGDKWDFDAHAMIQNTLCNIEKMMKIFPNLDKIKEG